MFFATSISMCSQSPLGFLHASFCISESANDTKKIQVSMALFLSADIHQGDERFSVHSRGKQCAFMGLSALLTARNIPLVVENNI